MLELNKSYTLDEIKAGWAHVDWTDGSGKCPPYEFDRPDMLHIKVSQGIGVIRQAIGMPMYNSRRVFKDGAGYVLLAQHPCGDAVSPSANSHEPASLHRWGIDHNKSKAEGRLVHKANAKALAWDWNPGVKYLADVFDVYFDVLERLEFPFHPYRIGGLGIYMHWRAGDGFAAGFHTDFRDNRHPGFMARWFRDAAGRYHDLTWANIKHELRTIGAL